MSEDISIESDVALVEDRLRELRIEVLQLEGMTAPLVGGPGAVGTATGLVGPDRAALDRMVPAPVRAAPKAEQAFLLQLFDFVREQPGLTTVQIASGLQAGVGGLTFALARLDGCVYREDDRWYPSDQPGAPQTSRSDRDSDSVVRRAASGAGRTAGPRRGRGPIRPDHGFVGPARCQRCAVARWRRSSACTSSSSACR